MWESRVGSRSLFWKLEEKRIRGRYRLRWEIISE
jgi:hypothetical protein